MFSLYQQWLNRTIHCYIQLILDSLIKSRWGIYDLSSEFLLLFVLFIVYILLLLIIQIS